MKMNITIINGIPDDDYKEFESALDKLKATLKKRILMTSLM